MLIIAFDESRMRMTTFSPYCAGSVATRRSIALSPDLGRDAAVLRDAALGDVEVGEDLDARGDGGDDRDRHQRAAHAQHRRGTRGDVEVGRLLLDDLEEDF